MQLNKKVLCIGDSLALPRSLVNYEDTWIFQLKQNFTNFDFITHFKRGISTDVLVEWGGGDKDTINDYPFGADCLEHFKPQIVILQLGIVDCAPRLLKKGLESKLVSKMPTSIRNFYIKIIKKVRGRKINNTYVSIKKFEQNLINYFNRCQKQKVEQCIVIKIGTPSEEMVVKNPNIINNVIAYNAVYDKMEKNYSFVKCIDPLNSTKVQETIFTDGYHPNIKGNKMVFDSLKQNLFNE